MPRFGVSLGHQAIGAVNMTGVRLNGPEPLQSPRSGVLTKSRRSPLRSWMGHPGEDRPGYRPCRSRRSADAYPLEGVMHSSRVQPIIFTDSCLSQDLFYECGIYLSSMRVWNGLPVSAPFQIGMPPARVWPLKPKPLQFPNKFIPAAWWNLSHRRPRVLLWYQ